MGNRDDFLTMFNKVLRGTGRTEIREEDLSQDNLTSDQRMIKDFLVERMRDVAQEWDWKNLRKQYITKTEAGEDTYELEGKENAPIDHQKIKYLAIEEVTFDEIERIPDDDFLELRENDFDGVPDFYRIKTVRQGTGHPVIQLYPIPQQDRRLKVEYIQRIEEPDDSRSVPPVPTKPVLWGTRMDILSYDGEGFQQEAQMYQRSLQRAKQNEQSGMNLTWGKQSTHGNDFGIEQPIGNP